MAAGQWADNGRLLALLEAIHQLALLPYPFPEGATGLDPSLVLALGEIAGRANRAMAEHRQRSEDP